MSTNANAQLLFKNMSDLLFLNLTNLRDTVLNLNLISIYKYYFYTLILMLVLIFLLCLLFIRKFMRVYSKFLLITHRDINTKILCHTFLFQIKNNNMHQLMYYQYQPDDKDNDVLIHESQDMQFLGLRNSTHSNKLYELILNKITNSNADYIHVYIYDTHDRYVDTLCMFFGEQELMKKNVSLLGHQCIFATQYDNCKILFFLVDDILKKKKCISILLMLQSLEKDYLALQKVYYYDHSQQYMHPQIAIYIIKIAIYIVDKIV